MSGALVYDPPPHQTAFRQFLSWLPTRHLFVGADSKNVYAGIRREPLPLDDVELDCTIPDQFHRGHDKPPGYEQING